jgi:hypothetical protein
VLRHDLDAHLHALVANLCPKALDEDFDFVRVLAAEGAAQLSALIVDHPQFAHHRDPPVTVSGRADDECFEWGQCILRCARWASDSKRRHARARSNELGRDSERSPFPVGTWADRFASHAFTFGQWVPSTTRDDGVIELGWFEMSDEAQAFVAEMYDLGWVYEFDWGRWLGSEAGRRLSSGPEAVTSATAADLAKLLTAIIRSERFSDGSIAGAFESGLLLAICRRAQALATG